MVLCRVGNSISSDDTIRWVHREMKQKQLTRTQKKFWKAIKHIPTDPHRPSNISPLETSHEDWLKGYWRWKKQHNA